jgi:hypothetical protein
MKKNIIALIMSLATGYFGLNRVYLFLWILPVLITIALIQKKSNTFTTIGFIFTILASLPLLGLWIFNNIILGGNVGNDLGLAFMLFAVAASTFLYVTAAVFYAIGLLIKKKVLN